MKKRPLLLLLAVCAAVIAPAQASAPLQARLTAVLGKAKTPTGALVVELDTGKVVYAHKAATSFVPASNEKLPVAFAALKVLGPSYRIRTEVLGDGRLGASGVWRGNLALRGYGDPTLTGWGLRALAWQVRKAGIRRVTGSIVGDESYFDDTRVAPGWKSYFLVGESAPLSALIVNRGVIGKDVSLEPALAAATFFRKLLAKRGITVDGGPKTAKARGAPIGSVYSPPLGEIVRAMGTDSDNFTAEMVLKHLGAALGGEGTTAAGAAVVRAALSAAEIPLVGVRIVDGSGLSSLDRLTPRALVAILEAAWHDPEIRAPFVAALAVAGRTGTLERRLNAPPARGNVRAKTGTTNLALSLSGYVRKRFAFAVIENGYPLPYWPARQAQERFVQLLAAQ